MSLQESWKTRMLRASHYAFFWETVSRTVITHLFYFSECTKLSSTPPGSTALAWRPELGVVVYIYNLRTGEDEFKASLGYRTCLLPHKKSQVGGHWITKTHTHSIYKCGPRGQVYSG